MDPLHQATLNETDPAGDGGGAAFIPEPFVPAQAADAPESAPGAAEPQGWQQYTNDPEFQSWMAQQNSELFDARLNALMGQQQQAEQGQPQDLNSLLDPMGESYGQNLAMLLQSRDQQLIQQLQPVIEFVQNQQQTAATERLAAPILQADAAQNGPLSKEQNEVAMILADAFTTQQEQIYGAGNQRASQLGLQQALSMTRALAGSSQAAGRQESIDQLHAATQGLRVPAAAGGSTPTVLRPAARSPQELLERTFGPNGMTPTAA